VDYGAADQALLAQIASGDRAALEALYRRHSGWITARLQHRCADIDLVDTAVQDTFLAAWRGAKRYSGRGDVGAWLWGIAIRKLIDQLRARRPTPIAPELVNTSITHAVSFEEELLGSGAFGSVGPALARLEPDLQAVLLATAIDGLTTKEAARLLGVPQGTVKTRLMRARAQLRAGLA
jgi:RNA polymerase sigma-70 factor (ECF subfamily)